MIELTTDKARVLLVEVPEWLNPIVVDNSKMFGYSSIVCNDVENKRLGWINLDSRSWQILGFSDELTEEQAKQIVDFSEAAHLGVDEHRGGYLCYQRDYWYHRTALESFQSLLQANNITTRHLVLIEQK